MSIYLYRFIGICMYVYIYIEREREDRFTVLSDFNARCAEPIEIILNFCLG